MSNSNIRFAQQDQQTAKAAASTIGRFLKAKGLELPHTQALDLVGVLAGFADWRSLQAHLAAAEANLAATPITMSLDEFKRTFKPVKNPNNPHADFDGFGFSTGGADMAYVEKVLASEPDRVWTVVNGDTSSWLSSGYHYVNRDFYVITHVPAKDPRGYEIPYGHDIDEELYNVKVTNHESGEELFSDQVYASSPDDAIEQLSSDIEECSEDARDAGQLVRVSAVLAKV